MRTIDLNADLGEGFGDADRALLEVVTSANVACGFHAGDEAAATAVCAAAVERGIAIGAHVGYRDLEGFGRRELGLPVTTIESEAAEQLSSLAGWASAVGGQVVYVKPHGALYHRASADADCAAALVRAAGGLPLLAFPGSQLLAVAGAGGVPEGYADRGYGPDGTLVPRIVPGAVLGAEDAVRQSVRLASEGVVRSICVHGDSPDAGVLARRVREGLEAVGVTVRRFA